MRLKALASVYMLHSFKSFIQRLEKILELFKVKTSLKTEGFFRATQTSKFRNFGVGLKNRYFFTFASLKNVSEVVRPWELVRLEVLTSVYMLHTFKSFIRPLKKFLERFKVNISFKNEGFSRVDSRNNFKQIFKKSPLLYVCVIKKCFWGRTTMGVGAFESSGFRVHGTYFQKLHATSRKDFGAL